MKLWEPKSCCCCCTPRIGTLVLGYLGAIGGILEILGSLRVLFFSSEEQIRQMCKNQDIESCMRSANIGISIGMVIQLLSVILCVLLILGSNKQRPSWMLPYMIVQTIILVCLVLVCSIGPIVLFVLGAHWIAPLILIVILGIYCFLHTYFLLVVRVHYLELRDPHRGEHVEFQPVPYK